MSASGSVKISPKRVETLRDVARQFDVLLLVIADGDEVRVIEQIVARYQHRIIEQARRGAGLFLRLILGRPLSRTGFVAITNHRGQVKQSPRNICGECPGLSQCKAVERCTT